MKLSKNGLNMLWILSKKKRPGTEKEKFRQSEYNEKRATSFHVSRTNE